MTSFLKRRDSSLTTTSGFLQALDGTVGLDGRNTRSEQFLMDEYDTLQRDKVRILERWAGVFGTPQTMNFFTFDPSISALFPQHTVGTIAWR